MTASKAEQAQVAQRRERLIEARARGWSFAQIVAAPGFESYHGVTARACQDYARAMDGRHQQQQVLAKYQLTEELGRVEALERRAQQVLATNIEAGDREGARKCITELRKLSERRAKMLGLDEVSAEAAREPVKQGTGTTDELARKRARRRAAKRAG